MAYRTKSRNLSVIIPATPTCTQTDTETTVDGNEAYPPFSYHHPCSPVSPLKHPYRPREVLDIDPTTPVKHNAPSYADMKLGLKAEDIASPDLLAVANLFASMKQALSCMTKTFDTLSEQSERMSSLASEVKRAEDVSRQWDPHDDLSTDTSRLRFRFAMQRLSSNTKLQDRRRRRRFFVGGWRVKCGSRLKKSCAKG